MILKQRFVGGDGDRCFNFDYQRIDLLCTGLGFISYRISAVISNPEVGMEKVEIIEHLSA